MFEAMSRVLPVKLLHGYGKRKPGETALSARFTSSHHNGVLAFIRARPDQTITVDALAREAETSGPLFG